VRRYRCRVGHAFSAEGLLLGKREALESALWAAVVALRERSDLSRRIMKRLEATGRRSATGALPAGHRRHRTASGHAERLDRRPGPGDPYPRYRGGR
jgi:two-component system chemotaxis response regulator CheB